ncbi:F0F1 ATP synthase subunit B [Gordonia sinesedis]
MYLAAESGGTSNFLIPNATFFVCLLIFVIVFLVIRTMVVPPIVKVLDERQAMVAKTAADNKEAAAGYEDAETEYRDALRDARADATGIRDQARAEGNEELAAAKHRATEAADAQVAETTAQLTAEGERAAESARGDVDAMSATLAGRVLGTTVSPAASASKTSGTVE